MKFKKKKKFVAAKSTKSDQDVDEKEEEVVPSTVGKLEEAGWKGFCTAFTNILSRELKTSQTPILAETEVEEKLQKSKAEFKEKKLQALENRVEKDKGHEAVNILEKNFEMQLRKYATQGVVRLFNAVKEYQAHAGDDKAEKYKFNKMPLRQRAKLMAESKKEKFENALKKTTTKKDKKLKAQGGGPDDREGAKEGETSWPNRCRDVDFQIWDIQVDMQSPKRDVILKSTSQPALRTHTRRDDIRMLDVHLREVQLVLGHLEVSVTGALMDQARLLRRNLTLGMGGLTFEQVLSRAKGGIHLSNPQPPAASSKLVVSNLVAREAKVDVWCQLHLPDAYYLPKSLRDTIQVVSLGATRLDVKGAHVKLPSQALFTNQPAEGNVSIVMSKVWLNYLPLVKACWRSLLQHSNIFLGGLLSRHTWNPRQRPGSWASDELVTASVLRVNAGEPLSQGSELSL
ncbi:Pentatricopeptide repeat-containing protein MRL1 [Durusdinium trenchii]|uniref:Chloroplastic n=1 Tax=Durusdinium trenchii TaxID=1381693 RepID=A0ABP0I6Q1_9DINO